METQNETYLGRSRSMDCYRTHNDNDLYTKGGLG